MNENEKILTQISKITQMGQSGIESVMPLTKQPALRQALKYQRLEYEKLENQAKDLAKAGKLRIGRGNPMAQKMAALTSRAQLMTGDADSKIAGMMIQGNTRGMIQSLKSMHRAASPDPQVAQLAQQLLETEINNIRQMKGFL